MKKLFGLLGFTCLALAARPAEAADKSGDKGQIWSLQINAPGSDDYSAFRGAIKLKGWKKEKRGRGKGKKATFIEYQWGGSNCPSRDLTGDQISVLTTALAQNLKLEPTYVNGQLPGSRCLVSFKVFRAWGDKDD